jgi:branched-chain amino acid transport system permease protein
VLLGLALNYVAGYWHSALVPLAAFLILLAVLMVRPTGLFSAARERRV